MVTTMTLLATAIQYIDRVNNMPSLATLTPGEARALKMKKAPKLTSPLLQSITDHTITVRDDAPITLRIYRPKTMRKLPIIVYYHGGGWVINDINTSHESCIQLAYQTEHIVISVNYRLAPEYKFPTPLNDAFDAFLWVKGHLNQLHALDNISVAGDSAGANLATVVAKLAAEANVSVASQLLLYPVTNLKYDTESYIEFASGYGLDRDVMQWFGSHYVHNANETHNPLISPLLQDVSNLPPTLIIAAQYDVLRDEAIAYAEKLTASGVDVNFLLAKGLVHSYFTNNDLFGEQITWTIETIQAFLQKYEPNLHSKHVSA